ncbi:phage head-tail connector protein [Paenibacillus larvae]|uniref:Phage head-tail connector protein n=1 Tax=Paenibacillus larvae TaxID=1464 RepID=A0AAP5JR32_9BACL|nr:phage head-tail connector protein [Paenibacillus larvae]AQR76379.1 hypothetical protein BXP28_02255 [Paenibacillus larvae subsp. larvae]AVF22810.1 Phage gp6-like head-tail connector protein [Paenibacillus larvae subsp. larvae]ETK26533.1 phage protein [Paenibacillus larvae subsp. larvae DSM 25719]MCY7476050.1 phage head-tail connector protein [Paenibacillus larvae]MCY7490118.1 phage head-tail connector protein [Paenibacillus larvae]
MIQDRVKVRIPEITDDLLGELETTAKDRIKLRLGLNEYPEELDSITVEVICAMYNRSYHEGIKSETVDTFSSSFVDDILAEYDEDFRKYLLNKEKENNNNRGVVRLI